jgi:regulation of enolase protein 1 (concanavalin A-like superfamily)
MSHGGRLLAKYSTWILKFKHVVPFYCMYVDYNFEARLNVKVKFKYVYDQAEMMLRLDEENWIKLGIGHHRLQD